uniref:DNA-binding protein HU n=1 Tax=Vibrio tasmaniensis TaxID=212663 RepID=A0A0H3ZWL5_9VIBR|nr:DNA-binding protein HU [Vibrio tasmaniensis]
MAAYHIRYLDKDMGIIKSEAVYMRSLGDAKKSATRNATALTYKIEIGDIIDKPLAFRYATGKWDETEKPTNKQGNEMNRKELVDHIAEKADINKKEADAALKAIIDGITTTLADGDDVTLVGFGAFKITHRAAREGRNPKTGEVIQISASKSPTFKAGKELKAQVNP